MTSDLLVELPAPAADGSFASVVEAAPETWPFALPALLAINVVDSASPIPVRASVRQGVAVVANEVRPSARLELLGCWDGLVRICQVVPDQRKDAAVATAEQLFAEVPIRHFLLNGVQHSFRDPVRPTGKWPTPWQFHSARDLLVLCAYLHHSHRDHPSARAEEFRLCVRWAWPATELVVSLKSALERAQELLGPAMTASDSALVAAAMTASRRLLSGARSA